jgi:hypothetical protein
VPAADAAFVSLARRLRPEPEAVVPAAPATLPPEPIAPSAGDDVARDVRVFRARLADAFEAAREPLLRELAYAVLGRELLLAAPDVAAIAERILAEHPGAQPLRLRIAPGDLRTLASHAHALPPLESDPELAVGDAIVEFAGGHVDARLGVRLAAVLDGFP